MGHHKNSNFLGNNNRLEELRKGGVSSAEQAAIMTVNGVPLTENEVEVLLKTRPILEATAVTKAAVQDAILNRQQIIEEIRIQDALDAQAEDDEDENEDYFEDADTD